MDGAPGGHIGLAHHISFDPKLRFHIVEVQAKVSQIHSERSRLFHTYADTPALGEV